MSSPSATAIFVGGASLLHLRPKFSVTITEFGNSALVKTIFSVGVDMQVH